MRPEFDQVILPHFGQPGQGMARVTDEPERFVEQRRADQLGVGNGHGEEEGIGAEASQRRKQIGGQVLANAQLEIGVRRVKRRHQPRQQIGTEGGDDAEAEFAHQWSLVTLGQVHQLFGLQQNLPGLADDLLADGRDPQSPRSPFEQTHFQHGLDLFDLPAQGGLGDVAAVRRAAEVTFFRENHKIPQIAKRHAVHK